MPSNCPKRISSLIHYAYIHFASEEQYLAQTTFPDLKKHVLEHVDFIMKTLEISLKGKEGTKDNRSELLRNGKEWYSSHVLGTDRSYIPYSTSGRIK